MFEVLPSHRYGKTQEGSGQLACDPVRIISIFPGLCRESALG